MREQPVEPAAGDEGVVVEQDDAFAAAGADALVDGGGEAGMGGVAEQFYVGAGAEGFDGAVGGGVVDDDDFDSLAAQMAYDAVEATKGVCELIERGGDNGYKRGRAR